MTKGIKRNPILNRANHLFQAVKGRKSSWVRKISDYGREKLTVTLYVGELRILFATIGSSSTEISLSLD